MRIAFHTLGCKLNYSETATLREDLVRRGHDLVRFDESADVLIVNTCSVTENADAECRKVVRRGLRASPDARVVVTGCFAQLRPEEVAGIDGVAAVVGSARKHAIGDLLDTLQPDAPPQILVDDIDEATSFVSSRTGRADSRTRSFFKIQDGCDYSCSFCTIPRARGPARAMPMWEIQRELDAIARDGYHEVVLSGINIGEYRGEGGERFVDVVSMINDIRPPFRVRISSIEPNTITDELIDVIAASEVFVPHFHIPLQSGSAEILRKMRRRYNPEMYEHVVRSILERMPDAALGIDVIVGFPGETDDHFAETMRFLDGLPFAYLHVFTYSERPGTPAATMDARIDPHVRKLRTHRLRQLSEVRTREFHQRMIGTERVFVPEGYDAQTGTWDGWTENHVYGRLHAGAELVKRPYRVRCAHAEASFVVLDPLETLELSASAALMLPVLTMEEHS